MSQKFGESNFKNYLSLKLKQLKYSNPKLEHAEDIQMGDVIVGCNETDMAGMAYDDAIKVLKGLPLTVTIKYVKKSATTPNLKKRKRNNGSAKVRHIK